MTNRAVRLAARIGYGTRLGISILFPIGLYLDVIVGMFSIMLMSNLDPAAIEGDAPASFGWYFATTLVQGVFLNVILLIYLLVVYGICYLVMRKKY